MFNDDIFFLNSFGYYIVLFYLQALELIPGFNLYYLKFTQIQFSHMSLVSDHRYVLSKVHFLCFVLGLQCSV